MNHLNLKFPARTWMVTVPLNEKEHEALAELVRLQDMPQDAVLRQALRHYQLLTMAHRAGAEVNITKDGRPWPNAQPKMLPARCRQPKPCYLHGRLVARDREGLCCGWSRTRKECDA